MANVTSSHPFGWSWDFRLRGLGDAEPPSETDVRLKFVVRRHRFNFGVETTDESKLLSVLLRFVHAMGTPPTPPVLAPTCYIVHVLRPRSPHDP